MANEVQDLQKLLSCEDRFVEMQAGLALEIADGCALGHITSEQAKQSMQELILDLQTNKKFNNLDLFEKLTNGISKLAAKI